MKIIDTLNLAIINAGLTATPNGEGDKVIKVVVNAVKWVATAVATVGAVLVAIQIIKSGIQMSQSDSAEASMKAKKHLLYSIIGLVLIISAITIVQVLAPIVQEWLEKLQ